jgi:uncharacterized protein (TIGR02246 family)
MMIELSDLPRLRRSGLAGGGTPCAGGRSDPGLPTLARHERKGRIMNTRRIQREDEASIRQVVQNMQDAQNTKDGELFASAFAQEHDYIAINGMFLANQTRQDNARVHQRLYYESTSSLAGKYQEVDVRLNVSKIRLLASGVAVVHVRSEFRLKSDPDKKTRNIITAVMHKQQSKWEIVAFHNAPVQKREEEDTGFVIHMVGL